MADGPRFLDFGFPGDNETNVFQYPASADGGHWTPLVIGGDRPSVSPGADRVFLVRDGVVISNDSGTWFGTAVTK